MRGSARAWACRWTWLALLGGCSEPAPEAGRAAAPIPAASSGELEGPSPAQAPATELPPRRAVAGLAGLQVHSRVTFAADPARVHALDQTFLFPERVRLRLGVLEPGGTERVLAYRRGSRGYFVDEGTAVSRELEGEELRALCLQTELRRALFLWPDGFPWAGEGGERTAAAAPFGTLAVSLGADGRPASMRSLDADGELSEELRAIAWKPQGGRHFPERFELALEGEPVWREEVVRVETSLAYVDAFFLPPDRREGAARGAATVAALDLPACWELAVALPASPPATWESVRAAQTRERALWSGRGAALASHDWIELDARGAPSVLHLRARAPEASPGEGWTRRAEGPGWAAAIERLEHVDAERLAALRASAGGAAARIYLELAPASDAAAQLRLLAASAGDR